MKGQKVKSSLICLTAFVICIVLAGCNKSAQTDVSGTPTPSPEAPKTASVSAEQTDTTATTTATRNPSSLPAPAEAQAALERVYRNALVYDKEHTGALVVGDFNGDGSQDIAIAVKPARGMLGEINGEFANWIVEDPKRFAPPNPRRVAQSPSPESGPVKVEQSDVLLAIIHGYGQDGWHSTEATQSYLLKNAAGEGMRAVPLKSFPSALKVKENGANSRADIISEKVAGVAGFLYWASGKYAWHEE
jgi:hypothetical protein